VFHVDPESELRLITIWTAPGFGEIDPDIVKVEPTSMGSGDAAKEILVGGLVKVVSVMEVFTLVRVWVQTLVVVVVVVIDVDVEVERVVVMNVEVLGVVVVATVVVGVVTVVPWIMTLVVCVVLVT
jgi:hypothetical protein